MLVQIYIDPNNSTQVPDLRRLCTCRYVLIYISRTDVIFLSVAIWHDDEGGSFTIRMEGGHS